MVQVTNKGKKRTKPAVKSVGRKDPDYDWDLARQCEKMLGARVESMQYLGGKARKTCRVILKKGAPVFVSQRGRVFRAEMEGRVLKQLSVKGCLVPKLLAYDHRRTLIQQEICGERLSQALYKQTEDRVELVLDRAAASLAEIHQMGSDAGLDKLPSIGADDAWVSSLLERPLFIGEYLGSPPPRPQVTALQALLKIRRQRFIKWDARPGNAMVTKDDQVYWFDWEHCGSRNRLDDLAQVCRPTKNTQ